MSEYQENAEFWKRDDQKRVIGDWLARLPSVSMVSLGGGERVLEAGCGTGWVARRLANTGAKVYGCDREPNMLQEARAAEQRFPRGIEYEQADIANMPYAERYFDAITCIAVLIHASPEECLSFFKEAFRVLKNYGRIAISTMDPYVYQPESPNRNGRSSWSQYTPLTDRPMSESQPFHEDYRDRDGNVFSSTVWYHPEGMLPALMREAGLTVCRHQRMYVTKEVLRESNQEGEDGYPAFCQYLAVKK